MKKILVIDDIRTLDIFNAEITYCRTAESGIDALYQKRFDELHLDHDLGMEIKHESNGGILVAVEREAMNGCQVLQYCKMKDITLPSVVRIISSNPVGVKNIADCLVNDFGYTPTGWTGRTFEKHPAGSIPLMRP